MDIEELRTHQATPVQSLFDANGTAILEMVRASKLDSADVIFLRDSDTRDITICYGKKRIDEGCVTGQGFDFVVVELDCDLTQEVYRLLRLIEGIRGHQDSALWESHWRSLPWPGPEWAIDRSGQYAD